jgi:rsbT co-antagonist protein RsbR
MFHGAAIKDLSAPAIPIDATALVIPLVGALNSTRLRQLQEQCLPALEQGSASNPSSKSGEQL